MFDSDLARVFLLDKLSTAGEKRNSAWKAVALRPGTAHSWAGDAKSVCRRRAEPSTRDYRLFW